MKLFVVTVVVACALLITVDAFPRRQRKRPSRDLSFGLRQTDDGDRRSCPILDQCLGGFDDVSDSMEGEVEHLTEPETPFSQFCRGWVGNLHCYSKAEKSCPNLFNDEESRQLEGRINAAYYVCAAHYDDFERLHSCYASDAFDDKMHACLSQHHSGSDECRWTTVSFCLETTVDNSDECTEKELTKTLFDGVFDIYVEYEDKCSGYGSPRPPTDQDEDQDEDEDEDQDEDQEEAVKLLKRIKAG